MKKYIGILTACLCLALSGAASAQEFKDGAFDVPEMSEEIEALIGGTAGTKEGQKRQTSELYRLLKKDTALSAYGAGAMGGAYDPRREGAVTPARFQRHNTCWAFSSLAAGEQSLIAKGISDPSSLDFSEAHLAYFFYHSVEDPLGNTAGDGNKNISPLKFLDVGSNTIFSTFALANWVGAAEEAAAPFEGLTADTAYADDLAYADVAHLQNAYWINFKDVDAVSVVKQMIQKYGAAAINLYFSDTYYESAHAAYYFPLDPEQANNHSATIVGWDDSYPKENFNAARRPAGDGAWIVKNSYGPSWGDGGYFYLSYEDSAVNSGNVSANRARAYVFDFEPADNYDYNYQYDGSAGAYNATNQNSALTRVDSKGSIANVFSVTRRKSGEMLKAVSFALFDTAVSYSVQIYKNLEDASNPASGTVQFEEPVTGSTSYAGYYTVPLPVPVALNEGDTFSVVITLEKESGGPVNFFVDKSYQNGDWIAFTNETKQGQSFRFINGSWEDMADNGVTARIKAFSSVGECAAAERISLANMQKEADGNYAVSLWTDETRKLTPVIYPASASQALQWETSDASVVAVDADGTLRPQASGVAIVTGRAVDGSGLSVSCKVTVKQRAKKLLLSESSLKLFVGEAVALGLQLEPDDASEEEIVWQSSGKAVSVDSSGVVEALREGEAEVAAYLKSDIRVCAVCNVTVLKPERENGGSDGGGENAPAEPNGAPPAKAVKSADTSDTSGERAGFWLALLFLGLWMAGKGLFLRKR